MLTHWCVCVRVCFNTSNLTFNTCSYKVWLTWYVITWKDFFFVVFFSSREGSQEAQNVIQGYSAWDFVRRNMRVEQNHALGKIEHAAISADFNLAFFFFSFPLFLAQQHPVVKQPTCLPGWRLFSTSLLGIFSICASVSSVWNRGMKQNAWLVIITQQVINVWKW